MKFFIICISVIYDSKFLFCSKKYNDSCHKIFLAPSSIRIKLNLALTAPLSQQIEETSLMYQN